MNLSISNIAWESRYDSEVASLLYNKGIRYVDIAPTKYIKDFSKIDFKNLERIKKFWSDYGISIYGIQSLFFGTKSLNLFSNFFVREKMLKHLECVCQVSKTLNAKRLVFGSPVNRNISSANGHNIEEIYTDFFRSLSEIAYKYELTVCLEPNPAIYNCNFMTDSRETSLVVKKVNRDNIRMQLDTGSIIINNENPSDICKKYKHIISHIHISAPNLNPLDIDDSLQRNCFLEVKRSFSSSVLTLEMLPKKKYDFISEIEFCLDSLINL